MLGLELEVLARLRDREQLQELPHVAGDLHDPLHERRTRVELTLGDLQPLVVGRGDRDVGVGDGARDATRATCRPRATHEYFTSPSGPPLITYWIGAVAPACAGWSAASPRVSSSHSCERYFTERSVARRYRVERRSDPKGQRVLTRLEHVGPHSGEEIVLGVALGHPVVDPRLARAGTPPTGRSRGSRRRAAASSAPRDRPGCGARAARPGDGAASHPRR